MRSVVWYRIYAKTNSSSIRIIVHSGLSACNIHAWNDPHSVNKDKVTIVKKLQNWQQTQWEDFLNVDLPNEGC